MPLVRDMHRHESFDPRPAAGDGRAGPVGQHPAGIRRRLAGGLWSDRARGRAGGFGFPLLAVGAVQPGDASHSCLRQRGAAGEISAQAGNGRMDRRLRIDRSRTRAPIPAPCKAAPARARPASCCREPRPGSPMRPSPMCWWCGPSWTTHSRLHPGARRQGAFHAQDRRQILAARQRHRRDRDERCRNSRRPPAAAVRKD